jgi:hypothetical protein
VATIKVGVEAEAGAEVAEEVEETGGGGEVALLEAATIAVEVVQWVEVAPSWWDVAGVTSVSGRRTSEQFTLLAQGGR